MLGRRVNGAALELLEDGKVILCISEEVVNEVLIFHISGLLRNDLVYEFDDELSAAVSIGKNIEIDMRGVTYIASASLKVLLRIQQKLDSEGNKVEMRLTNVPAEIMTVFKDSGLSDILDIMEND